MTPASAQRGGDAIPEVPAGERAGVWGGVDREEEVLGRQSLFQSLPQTPREQYEPPPWKQGLTEAH